MTIRLRDWEDTLDDLEERRKRTMAMGGDERLAKHHGKGKLDARARIDRLVDKGSFREIGHAGRRGDRSRRHRRRLRRGQWNPRHGRRGGLHDAGGQHRPRR